MYDGLWWLYDGLWLMYDGKWKSVGSLQLAVGKSGGRWMIITNDH